MPDIKFIRFEVLGLNAYLELLVRDCEILLTDMDLRDRIEDHVFNLAWQYAVDLNVPLKCVVIDDEFLTGADKLVQVDWYGIHDPDFDLNHIVKLADSIGYEDLDSKPERQRRLVGHTPPPLTEVDIVHELQVNPAFAEYILWTTEELRIALFEAGYADCETNVELLSQAIHELVNPEKTLWHSAIVQSLHQLRSQLTSYQYHQAA